MSQQPGTAPALRDALLSCLHRFEEEAEDGRGDAWKMRDLCTAALASETPRGAPPKAPAALPKEEVAPLTLHASGVAFDKAAPAPRCTGLAATWCPVHGDCKCPGAENGERSLDDPDCPLHSRESTHSENADDAIRAAPAPGDAYKCPCGECDYTLTADMLHLFPFTAGEGGGYEFPFPHEVAAELARGRSEEREQIRQAMSDLGNALWNKYAMDFQWGAAQCAALSDFRSEIANLIRARASNAATSAKSPPSKADSAPVDDRQEDRQKPDATSAGGGE